MKIGNREFDIKGHTYIMGILNVTPDSFYDGGRFVSSDTSVSIDTDAILRTCESMIKEGVDIIDVGGESTRPGGDTLSEEAELKRVIPAIEAISSHFDTTISVDTYKAGVALKACDAGARLINDVWGLKGDPEMAEAAAEAVQRYKDVAVCIMHNRRPVGMTDGIPVTLHGEEIDYGYRKAADHPKVSPEDLFMDDMKSDLKQCIKLALDAGITPDKIILDPGVGFAKTYEQNLISIRRMNDLSHLTVDNITYDYPILLGCSRKSVIGKTLDKDTSGRLYGTLATTAFAVMNDIPFVRVHDVEANAEVIRMTTAIRYS